VQLGSCVVSENTFGEGTTEQHQFSSV